MSSEITSESNSTQSSRWSPESAWNWYRQQPWLVGCNFIPSTAINQLEMFQADTFDLETMDRELGLADQPIVKSAVAKMKQNGYTLRSLIQSIVASEPFTTK